MRKISRLETIGWENHSWKYLSLVGDERLVNLQRTKVYVFSDSVLCLGKILEHPQSKRCMGTKIGMVEIFSKYRNFDDRINGEPMEFEWNIFPGFNTLQLSDKVKDLLNRCLKVKKVHKEYGTELLKGCWNSLKADVQFSVFRPPLS